MLFDGSDPFARAASAEGVASAFVAARDGIDAVLRDRGMRRTGPQDTAASLLKGAEASAALEGVAPEGSVLLSSELLSLVPTWRQAPLQALARMHSLASAGSPDDQTGRPASREGAARLTQLAQAYIRPTEAPGLVVAALVHAEIADSNAFASNNGVIARAAERLVLVAKGVDPASLIVPEVGHASAPQDYQAALNAYGDGNAAGTARWLLYSAQALGRGTEASPVKGVQR